MKTTRIQFNAKTFKANRDIISAYFGAKYELAEELDRTQRNVADLRKVILADSKERDALLRGENKLADGTKIVRTLDAIKKALETNTESYNAKVAPYEALVAKTSEAIAKAVALFNNKDSALYKAYSAYVLEPTDDSYNNYAKAMADKFVAMGLTDATVDNVTHYMVNADRERKGKSAVKAQKIVDALTPKAFADAVLRKLYDNNKDAFPCEKFVKYCEYVKAQSNK